MGWYQALYEGNGRGEGPSGPRPKGLGLLGHILRWHWWTLVKANVLFCLFCLPLVTIPAALKALTRVCVLLLRGEPLDLWPDWWSAFRTGFWRTTAAGAAMALLLAGGGFAVSAYGRSMADNGLWAAPALVLLVLMGVVVMSLFSLFPLLEFSELRLGEMVRSALLLVLVRLPQNLAALGVLIVLAVGYVLAFPWSSFVLGAIALSLFWLVACYTAWPGLEEYAFHSAGQEQEPGLD